MEKYISQKAQKIVSALYLVTNLVKDNDVIKWEIREESISFVSHALMMNTTVPFEKDQTTQLIISSSHKLISFLKIAVISGLVSAMNSDILIREIESLIEFINKNNIANIHPEGYILSDSFFATDTPIDSTKRQLVEQEDASRTSNVTKNKAILIKDKKNNRQESIINLLKKDSNLTIKDFVRVIKDCSEKTIQRELIALVEKGIVKRVGERRWSTYSLT